MAAKDKGKRRILEGQIAFEFFGELDTEIKPIKQKKARDEIKKEKNPKAIKPNHIKKNRKIRRF